MHRRGTQIRSKQRLNFVLRSNIDPVGDQYDVQHLSILLNIFAILGTSGTVPIYLDTIHIYVYALNDVYVIYMHSYTYINIPSHIHLSCTLYDRGLAGVILGNYFVRANVQPSSPSGFMATSYRLDIPCSHLDFDLPLFPCGIMCSLSLRMSQTK